MKHLTLAALVAATLALAAPAFAEGALHITDPYARIISGAGVVYFRIDNQTDHDDTLIGATSDVGMTMLMTSHEDANGVMQMDPVMDGFAVPAGSERVLAAAGDHVMLSGITGTYKKGDTITVVLTFATAGAITLTAPVDITRRDPPGPGPTPFDVMSAQ